MTQAKHRGTDVVVIGGGPAGAAAARLLAGWGHDVTLVSRSMAASQALAESLPPSSVRLLERVGVLHAVDAAGFIRATGNTVRWGAGDDDDAAERVEMFPGGSTGYQVDRARFDAVLLGEAVAAGAVVHTSASATRVERDDGGARVTFDRAGTSVVVEAPWVFDCTGRAGLLARQGWRAQPSGSGPRTIAIAGVWERDDTWPLPDQTHTVVESFAGGWGWSVPVSSARRFVTVMLDPALTTIGARDDLARTYHECLARTHSMRRLTSGARRVGEPFARDATPYHASHYGERGAILVGDAGSFVDPLSSFGIKKALASAWLAAVVARSCLVQPDVAPEAIALFDARERAMCAALTRQAEDLARHAASGGRDADGFWTARARARDADAATDALAEAEPDVAALRADPDVRRALDELRARDRVRLLAGPNARRERRATVRGNRVVTEDYLVVPAYPRGIRYVRSVDLVRLADLAPAHEQVPDLYDAYNRVASPAALPDFLGALSLLVARGALVLA